MSDLGSGSGVGFTQSVSGLRRTFEFPMLDLGRLYGAAVFQQVHVCLHAPRGRKVDRVTGPGARRVHLRQGASDF
jgi:hypothetical protein